MDAFDKKLADRYKEVFDDHRDDAAAEGWALLQQKRGKAKPVRFYWLSGAAALLLLAFGLSWYFMYGKQGTGNREQEMVNGKKSKVENGERKVESAKLKPAAKDADKNSTENLTFIKKQPKSHIERMRNQEILAVKTPSKTSDAFRNSNNTWLSGRNTDAVFLSAKSTRPSTENAFANADVKPANLLADPLAHLFAEEKTWAKRASSAKKETKNNVLQRVLALSVFVGSQVNYGKENTRKSARPTGGLQAEVALSKRFSVSLGAGIADYQLAYNEGLPAINSNNDQAPNSTSARLDTRTASSGKRTPLFVQKPSAQNGSLQNNALVTYSYVSTSAIKIDAVTARFTAVELPLAVSWKALTGKTGLAFTAAINSTWMIREAYQADFSVQSFRGSVTPVNSQKSNESFTAFTPFSAMQFSIGVKPGGSNSRFAIEPFARFPLQNQGLEQLRYGAAGLNLKFRLNNINKK